MKLEVLPCKTGFQEPMLSVGGKIIDVFLQTLDGCVYIDLYMGLLMGLYTWAQYTPTEMNSSFKQDCINLYYGNAEMEHYKTIQRETNIKCLQQK